MMGLGSMVSSVDGDIDFSAFRRKTTTGDFLNANQQLNQNSRVLLKSNDIRDISANHNTRGVDDKLSLLLRSELDSHPSAAAATSRDDADAAPITDTTTALTKDVPHLDLPASITDNLSIQSNITMPVIKNGSVDECGRSNTQSDESVKVNAETESLIVNTTSFKPSPIATISDAALKELVEFLYEGECPVEGCKKAPCLWFIGQDYTKKLEFARAQSCLLFFLISMSGSINNGIDWRCVWCSKKHQNIPGSVKIARTSYTCTVAASAVCSSRMAIALKGDEKNYNGKLGLAFPRVGPANKELRRAIANKDADYGVIFLERNGGRKWQEWYQHEKAYCPLTGDNIRNCSVCPAGISSIMNYDKVKETIEVKKFMQNIRDVSLHKNKTSMSTWIMRLHQGCGLTADKLKEIRLSLGLNEKQTDELAREDERHVERANEEKKICEKAKERRKELIACETLDERTNRLRRHRESKKRMLANETDMERIKRLRRDREYKKRIRANENMSERRKRLDSYREYRKRKVSGDTGLRRQSSDQEYNASRAAKRRLAGGAAFVKSYALELLRERDATVFELTTKSSSKASTVKSLGNSLTPTFFKKEHYLLTRDQCTFIIIIIIIIIVD